MKCKKCGTPINWRKVKGRWFCFNLDGTDHWDLCSTLKWRQVVMTGERFETTAQSGYANSIHGTKLDRLSAKPIRGDLYNPSGDCADCCPPWDVCSWPCPDSISGDRTPFVPN